jgi:hypothetical protein
MSIYVNTTLFRTDIGSPRATGTRGVFAATGSNKISSRRFAVFKILQSVTDVPRENRTNHENLLKYNGMGGFVTGL